MGKKYIKCPRCELNYILEGEDFCAVCKAEMKHSTEDDELLDIEDMELCPVCGQNYIKEGEPMCEDCRKKNDNEEDCDEPVAKIWTNGDEKEGVSPMSDIDRDDEDYEARDYPEEDEVNDPYKNDDNDLLDDDDLLSDESIEFSPEEGDEEEEEEDEEEEEIKDDFEVVEPASDDDDDEEEEEDEDDFEINDMLKNSKK